jgi:HSP20 family protein
MGAQNFDPLKGLQNLRDSVNRTIEDVLTSSVGTLTVAVDMYETADSLVVKLGPLLGANPDQIDVSITGSSLTIKGETIPEPDVVGAVYLRRERKYGSFARTVTIPVLVKPDQAKADFKELTLIITLPKADEVRAKTINVNGT